MSSDKGPQVLFPISPLKFFVHIPLSCLLSTILCFLLQDSEELHLSADFNYFPADWQRKAHTLCQGSLRKGFPFVLDLSGDREGGGGGGGGGGILFATFRECIYLTDPWILESGI